jgi:CBS domain-containing protein
MADTLYIFTEQIVTDYMTRNVVTVAPELTVRELGQRFNETDFNGFPVMHRAQMIGFVTKFDYLACFEFTTTRMLPRYDDLMRKTVAEIMAREFIYVASDTKLTRVLQLMTTHRFRSLPIIEADSRLAGIISREDVIRALEFCAQNEEGA